MKFSTTAIHAGYHSDPTTRAAAVPVYQTTSYTFDDSQHGADLFNLAVAGNIYTRMMNPTHAVLEARVAALEGGVGALALASGMSAIAYALQVLCSPGSNIVSTSQLYGGTYNLFAHSLPNQGVTCRFVAHDDLAGLEAAIDDDTRALFCESIGNPAGNVVDLAAWAAVAERHGVPLIVDNTVATPYLCRPFEHGAHIVVHSLTKYIGGHGTTLGGAIVDSGKFDWKEHAQRFPLFSNSDRPTTGWCIPRHSARRPTLPAAGWCRCAIPARRCRPSMPFCCCRGWRRWRCAWSATAAMRWRWPSGCRSTRRWCV